MKHLTDTDKTKEQLIEELNTLRSQVAVLQKAAPCLRETLDITAYQALSMHPPAWYRQIVETVQDGIWVINLAYHTKFVTRRMADMLGYVVEEMGDRCFLDYIAETERADVIHQLETLQPRAESSFYVHLSRQDGSVLWAIASIHSLLNEQDQSIGYVVQVTDLIRQNPIAATLQDREARLRRIVDSNIIGVFFGNLSGVIKEANDALLQMLGYTREELLEGRVRWDTLTPSEHMEATQRCVAELCTRGTCTPFEKEFFRKDGSRIWVQLAAALLDGEEQEGVCYVIDLTARKQAEAERDELLKREQEARNRAEVASRLKDEFLAIVSHELRSPLNAILGWSRLLQMKKLDPDKAAHALEVIERNAQAQTQLIEDLLDISRIIRGQVRLFLQPIHLARTIETALDTVRPLAQSKQITLETVLDPAILVSGDAHRLQQVVWNLLSNALKFTPEGGQVTIHLERVESHAQIQIVDTGIGISPDFLPHVFDRFRQADATSSRDQKGLGLGLAIVRNLVELHEGTVEASSEGKGRGTTFTIWLPLLSAQPDHQDESYSGYAAHASLSLRGLKALVVDDDLDTLEFLETVLEQQGVIVQTATSAQDALRLLQQGQPDVLLSDIGMPNEDGYALIRQIRRFEASHPASLTSGQGKHTPAVALTAYTRDGDRRQALDAGFQMHVSKPIDPIQLLTVVAQLTGHVIPGERNQATVP